MMGQAINSQRRFKRNFYRAQAITATVCMSLLVGITSIAFAQSGSDTKNSSAANESKTADGSSAKQSAGRSLTTGLKTPRATDGSNTKNSNSKNPTKGPGKKNSGGAASKNSNANKGSSTRNQPGGSNIDFSKVPKYQRLESTELDADFLNAALDSAEKIDAMIDKDLKKNKVRPEKVTDDYEFVRRAYLDISGTIPTGRQAVAFVRSRKSRDEKRSALVDHLLNSRGYVSHSFNLWAEILRLTDNVPRTANLRPYNDWVKDAIANDMPYNDFVSQLLSAEGRIWENPPVGYALRDRDMNMAILDNSMRTFLGTRIGCAQCHDHPFDTWTQKQFYELAAFIHGTRTNHMAGAIEQAIAPYRSELEQLPETIETAELKNRLDRVIDQSIIGVIEDRDARLRLPKDYKYDNARPRQKVEPKVAFGSPPVIEPGVPLRATFADWVTSPGNPRFAMTIANRLWKRVFGVGLIEPIDNHNDATEASNQELLDFLVAEFQRVGYRQREFLRILYNTKTYQRNAFLGDWNPNEPYYFQGPILRRMTAQQLWDSMLTLTLADPDLYERPRGEESLKVVALDPDKTYSMSDIKKKYEMYRRERSDKGQEAKLNKVHSHDGYLLVRASEMPQPQRPDHFLRQFGQGDRTLISGDSVEGHVPQILTMFNGPISHKLLYEGTVIYDEVAGASTASNKIEVIFLSILTRPPTRLDKRVAMAEMESAGAAGVGNLIWSLLNTREFMFIQ
jgi:hypothetical protein